MKGTTLENIQQREKEIERGKNENSRDRNLFLRKPEGGFLSSATKPRKDARGFLWVEEEKRKERTVYEEEEGRKEGREGCAAVASYEAVFIPA